MDLINKMNKAVHYIESNLPEKIDLAGISKEAGITPFHFQRMFHMLSGIAVGEYIRSRRLTLAAGEIISSADNIINIALKYGYESHASFTRAFTKYFGLAPAAARETGAKVKAYPPLNFHYSARGEVSIDYKIRELRQFNFVGKTLKVSQKTGEGSKKVPEFIYKCYKDGIIEKIMKNAVVPGIFKGEFAGAIVEYTDNYDNYIYMLGAESRLHTPPEGLEGRIIRPQSYAVFEDTGHMPETIQKLRGRIYSEWFPATEYTEAEAPNFEVAYPVSPEAGIFRCEIWIPVILGK